MHLLNCFSFIAAIVTTAIAALREPGLHSSLLSVADLGSRSAVQPDADLYRSQQVHLGVFPRHPRFRCILLD